MPWTDFFPILTDEHVDHFRNTASTEEQKWLEKAFEGLGVPLRNSQKHLICLSLSPDPTPPVCCFSVPEIESASGAFERIFIRLRNTTLRFASELPEARLRIYLDPRWSDWADELLELGCEVIVMAQSSSGPNPASLWRFLALEEDVPTTFMSLADLEQADDLIQRTEALKATGFKMWRTPMDRRMNYRPIHPDRFGCVRGMPVRDLLCAFVWYVQQAAQIPADGGSIEEGEALLPLHAKHSERQADWNRPDLAEFFLMSAIYPRAAFDGMLSLIEVDDQHSRWQLLDIEYATWANPDSEVVFVRPFHPIQSMNSIDFKESTLVATMFARLALENRYPGHFEAWQQEMHPGDDIDFMASPKQSGLAVVQESTNQEVP